MAFDIYGASPKSLALIEPGIERKLDTFVNIRSKYKFDQLQVGQCFLVKFADYKNEGGLRVRAAKEGKKSNKKFAVIKHITEGCYEVARIA